MKKTTTTYSRRFCNHELLGCRVAYAGEKYRVTGARKPDGQILGFKFRLLDWKRQREFWTEQGPCFDEIEPPMYQKDLNQ
jgi:hypothetical protein